MDGRIFVEEARVHLLSLSISNLYLSGSREKLEHILISFNSFLLILTLDSFRVHHPLEDMREVTFLSNALLVSTSRRSTYGREPR